MNGRQEAGVTNIVDQGIARPWYREPWPWILMAGPATVIVAAFFTLWLAIDSDDGLVADDYYKRGLAINQTMSRAQRAEELQLNAKITFGADARHVQAEIEGDAMLAGELRLRIVHPTRAMADQQIVLRPTAPGRYAGELPLPVAGKRVVMLEDAARSWRLAGEASTEKQAVVNLTPQ